MQTTLQIIVIVGLVGILLLVCVGFFILRFVKNIAKEVKDAVSNLPDIPGCPPSRINLLSESLPQWRNAATIQKYANEFKTFGFEQVDVYRIPELKSMLMMGFVHPNERMMGVIYDHKQIEPTIDIVADYEDGTDVTGTNTTMGDTLDKRPGHEKLWLGAVSVSEVFEAVKGHSQLPRKEILKSEFAARFKKSYADGMNWRLKKGGTSREEIKRQAEKNGKPLTEEDYDQCYENMRTAYIIELQSGCIAQYLDDKNVPALAWDRLRDRAFAIPETMTAKEVAEALSISAEFDEDQMARAESLQIGPDETALNLVDKVMANDGKTLTKLGEVKEPVNAYILLGPEEQKEPDEND